MNRFHFKSNILLTAAKQHASKHRSNSGFVETLKDFGAFGRNLFSGIGSFDVKDSTLWQVGKPNIVSETPGFVKKWAVLNDQELGGKSNCKIAEMTEENEFTNTDAKSSRSFMRITGAIQFDKNLTEATNIVKGGFCAINGRVDPIADLRDYEGLEMVIRCVTRQVFTINITNTSLFEDDMYQLRIDVAGGPGWRTLHIPFYQFRLTARGQERELQRVNDSLRVETIGFLFTDEHQLQEQEHVAVASSIEALPILQATKEGNRHDENREEEEEEVRKKRITNTEFALDIEKINAIAFIDEKHLRHQRITKRN